MKSAPPAVTAGPAVPWHALSAAEVLMKLESSTGGLRDRQVQERRRQFGPNVLPSKAPPTLPAIFLHQFGDNIFG